MKSGDGGTEESTAKPAQSGGRKRGPLAAGVRTLVALTICCGVVFWACRVVMDAQDPLGAASRGLRWGSRASRLEAVQEVTEKGLARGKDSIPPLVETLGDSDVAVRAAAAHSLGLIASYAVRVQANSEPVRGATAALAKAMKDPETRVRVEAARALAMITATVPTGGKRGGGKKAANIGKSAAAAGIDVESLADSYKQMLGESEESIRIIAIEGLGALGPALDSGPAPELVAALDDPRPKVRIAALNAVGGYSKGLDPLVPKLASILAHDPDVEVKLVGSSMIGGLRPSSLTAASVPALVAAMKAAGGEASFSILMLIAGLNDEARRAAVPAFLEALRAPADADRPVGGMGAPSPNAFTGPAQVAAKALGRTTPGTPQAGETVTALAGVLKTGPPSRWPAAADALAAFGPAAAPAVPDLIATLKKSESHEKIFNAAVAAAKALAAAAPDAPSLPDVLTALKAAVKSPIPVVRQAAEKALDTLTPKSPEKKGG